MTKACNATASGLNDAPERIWARTTKTKSGSWDDYHMVTQRFWCTRQSASATEYIRADRAQAELQAAVVSAANAAMAAEREACADILWRDRNWVPDVVLSKGNYMLWAASENIRARTDTDEQAALEAVKREARNEGLREAAHIADGYGSCACDLEMRDAILALMEDTDDE